ncbi:hypothetical protein IPV69_02015 [Humisphaera borealis]|uniref:Glycosyltransferase family 1 protein n=2 Tax=Humisphaera borealis TaxID=2807512 RepID=A0A7M2X3F3_9BACT|nr:hypothetical protein IPV69_02015 [Humisphaera borealis]
MMSRWPVAGVAWVTVQYLEGFRRLGYDVYYAEAHGCTQTKFMQTAEDDGVSLAADYIGRTLARFGFADRWAYHDVHDTGRCFGLSREKLYTLYKDAGAIINLHGGTEPLLEHSATGRLIYLETDPVEVQIGLGEGSQPVRNFLDAHASYFTWGLNYGKPDCKLPTDPNYVFHHSPPLVVTDFWSPNDRGPADTFTTIGNWKQGYKQVILDGETYHWSKHLEFLKFIDLPRKTPEKIELAISPSSIDEADTAVLRSNGWLVRNGVEVSAETEPYRRYLQQSRGEFTVAKDQNIRLRSGWFSERSAQYLAAGRPVVTQDTGFGSAVPLGEGVFAFNSEQEILSAFESIRSDYNRHRRAALDVACDLFNFDKVLPKVLASVGA